MKIIDSIYSEPEKWKAGPHHFTSTDGVSIWSANGLFFFQLETGGSFNLIQKCRAYRAYRWWLTEAPIKQMTHRASNP